MLAGTLSRRHLAHFLSAVDNERVGKRALIAHQRYAHAKAMAVEKPR
jgi:hypothetical protein